MRKIILKNGDNKLVLRKVGREGPKGDTGPGVPDGGNTGQHLAKASNDNQDTEWVDASNILSVNGQTGPTVTIDKTSVGLGNVDNTSDANKPVSTATQTALDGKINITEKGANNGVATLDSGGKIPSTQLPSSIMQYQGTWNASTNTPTLADGVGDAGDVYIVSVAGTQNLGSGNITFGVGDWVIYNGTIWQKSDNTDAVSSVFGREGAVTAQTSDYDAEQIDFDTTEFDNAGVSTDPDVQSALDTLLNALMYFIATAGAVLEEKASRRIVFNTYTGTHIASGGDIGSDVMLEMNSGSANNLTIPHDDGSYLQSGDQINVIQLGTGQTTLNPDSGVTILATPGLKLRARYSVASLVYKGADVWYAYGDLTL